MSDLVPPQKFFEATQTSYGGVVTSVKDGENVVLLEQRRDTYQYTGLICGDYTQDTLLKYFNGMTVEEKLRLSNFHHSYDALWDDLFIKSRSPHLAKLYEYGKAKFREIQAHIPSYIKASTSDGVLPWSCPKGEQKRRENVVECIIREVYEETRILVSEDDWIPGIQFQRSIIGTNDRTYNYIYYLFRVSEPMSIPDLEVETPNRIRAKSFTPETACAKWVTFEEARTLVDESVSQLLSEVEMYQSYPGPNNYIDIQTLI